MNLALILLKTEPAHPLFDAVLNHGDEISTDHFNLIERAFLYLDLLNM